MKPLVKRLTRLLAIPPNCQQASHIHSANVNQVGGYWLQ